MDRREWEYRIEAIRQYVQGAAAGIAIGALIIVLAPTEIRAAFGLQNARPSAVMIALFAAALWAVLRLIRIRRK